MSQQAAANYDMIIIGGGISGLLLGALFSKKNLRVIVCEKRSQLGGRYRVKYSNGFEIGFGFKGNRFAQQGYVQELFDLLAEPIEFITTKEILSYENGCFAVLPRGLKQVLQSSHLSWKEKLVLTQLYHQILSARAEGNYKTSLQQWLSKRTSLPNVVNMFRYYSQLGLVSPDLTRTSLGEFVFLAKTGFTATYPFGVPRGGWGKKLTRLKEIIAAKGDIVTNCRVDKIVVEQAKVKGVQCNLGFLSAKAVIAAFPLNPGLFKLVGEEHFKPEWVENIKNLKPTTGINLDFCLSKKITDENRLIATHEPYPITQGIMESNLIPEIAPPGKQYGSWLLLVPHEKFTDRAYLNQHTALLEKLLAEMFPGMWDYCEWKRVMRLSMVNAVAPGPEQSWEDRPDFIAPGLDNLFLVGDSTRGYGGGGDVTISAVLQVYKLIMAKL
jgi:phytoene dehydrogenase-like protein